MNFQLRSDRYEKKKIPYIKFCISLFVFLFILQLIFPKIIPAFFARTILPLFPIKTDERDQRIEELSFEIEKLKSGYFESLASTSPSINSSFIKANVIMLPPLSKYDSLVLDKGLTFGIDVGDDVLVGSTTIGKIKESYSEYSRVELFSSPGQNIEVRIGTSSIPSTAFGRGAGNFEVLYPRESPIKADDQVIIPSIGSDVYSFVSEVISDPANPFIVVVFTNPVSIQSISYVHIKKK